MQLLILKDFINAKSEIPCFCAVLKVGIPSGKMNLESGYMYSSLAARGSKMRYSLEMPKYPLDNTFFK